GVIPSTTFIVRLENALAKKGIRIIITGQIASDFTATERKKIIGYKSSTGKVLLCIKYLLLFLIFRPHSLRKIFRFKLSKYRSIRKKINNFAKISPIIWHQPDIFHLQWAS